MKLFINRKVLYVFLFILTLSSILIVPAVCYAKTETKITVGKEITNTSSSTDYQYYTLNLKNKMKVKINVTVEPVEEQTESDAVDYDDLYWYPNSIEFSMEGEYYNTIIKNSEIYAGETLSKTIVLEAGIYKINVYTYAEGLNYTIKLEDKSTYAKKIAIKDKLSLVTGDSKKITVKSKEKGKSIGEVIWTTSNKKIATVDESGNVTGISKGTCTISAKTKNAKTVKCSVTISPRPQLYITDSSFKLNFLGGVEPYITLQNNFGKTIKYIYFDCYFYNTVDDPAYCEIRNTYHQKLQITGPIKNKVTNTYYWDAVIYNNSTGKMYIKSADVQFMDGTKKTVSIKKSYK